MKKTRRRYRFYGRVQGVGFRYKATYAARMLELTGWVKNEYDGTVSMEVQGQPEYIDSLICKLFSDRIIEVTNMDVSEIPMIEEREFREKY